ncbi:HlyD family secretion protein [Fodinibius halophilus]|uniref:Biotin/lipoyl-binding protein n=1 Tax=Fodinibius halophilus TaxID=1736908 RepID=A0A6M1T3F9_9BACT|nr:biotin/lipoyl-binding protein [Fodinibius halophilus]NGP87163.1 biotin/lipoyl-binding protein [Fodinibius halophilus]
MNIRNNILALTVLMLLVSACGNTEQEALQGKFKRETLELTTKVPGRIIELKVEEGDVVHKGDTLAVLDIPEVEAKLQQAEGAWLSAKSQHDMAVNGATSEQKEQVDAVYQAAKEQFEFLKKTMQRMSEMYNDSLISAQKYDEVMAKFKGAKAQYEQARAKKEEVLVGVRTEKVRITRGQLNRAEGALEEATIAYDERYIVAPATMDIQTISLDEGELALAGYSIFTGYRLKAPYLRFTVAESKLGNFKTGTSYNVKDPYTEKQFTAKLVSVKQLAAYANKTSSYPNYSLGEAVYELKMIPASTEQLNDIYTNTTILLNQ